MLSYFPLETINLGFFSIKTWGVFVALGFGGGLLFTYFHVKKLKQEYRAHLLNLGFWALLGGISGSRLLFILGDLKYFFENPKEIFQLWHGGMSIFGGILLAIFFCYLYIKKHKLNFWQIGDLLSPGLALGLAIGRIGCFLIHDHLGVVMKTPRPWGINYFGEVRHEISLYLILSNFLLFLGTWIFSRYIKKEGVLFLIFLLWYGGSRLLIDSLRDFETRYYGLMISQWLALAIIIFVLGYLGKNYLFPHFKKYEI